jgi:hypothetical protein
MKRILLFLFVIAVCLAISESPVLLAGPPKVLLCHVPPGNPAKAHVISVSPSAVPAHLAHGDCFADPSAQVGQLCNCELPSSASR